MAENIWRVAVLPKTWASFLLFLKYYLQNEVQFLHNKNNVCSTKKPAVKKGKKITSILHLKAYT